MIEIASKIIYGPDGSTNLLKSGYASAGASKEKRAFKGFNAISTNPKYDIDRNNSTMRQRSRMLYMASPIATSAIRTNRTNVIGCGLILKSRIDRKVLGLSDEQAKEMEQHIEREFALWAENKRACDATGINDFYSMQQLALVSWLLSGDAIVLFKLEDATGFMPYELRLHIVEADRLSTPVDAIYSKVSGYIDNEPIGFGLANTEGKFENGNMIYDGVEVDQNGKIVAYHICSNYPNAVGFYDKVEWVRVLAYGEDSGLPNVLHLMDTERPDQYRGVPYLAHVIEPILQTRRYTESELQAAVIEAFFTAFIKTDSDPNNIPWNNIGDVEDDPNDYSMGPGTINIMKPGEEVQFADPKRPSSGFDTFIRSISDQIGAALEIPSDLLLKKFNASYSASRAALLEAWKSFKMRREWFVSDFCRPVYERWFTEAVTSGRIHAKGFFDDALLRAAWLGSEWIGPSQGQLDPVKEVTASVLAIKEGMSTRADETIKLNGGSWEANMLQISKENKMLEDCGLLDIPSGVPKEPDRTEQRHIEQEVENADEQK